MSKEIIEGDSDRALMYYNLADTLMAHKHWERIEALGVAVLRCQRAARCVEEGNLTGEGSLLLEIGGGLAECGYFDLVEHGLTDVVEAYCAALTEAVLGPIDDIDA